MHWSKILKLYFLTIPIFFIIDIVWLKFVAKDFYFGQLRQLFEMEVNWIAALAIYFILIAGILIFAVLPALKNGRWQTALFYGAFFGFCTYATYDLTNLATLKGWPISIVVVDMIWGSTLCGLVALGSFRAGKWLLD